MPPPRASPDRARRLYSRPPSQPPSSRVAGAASTRWSMLYLSTRCAPGPGPNQAPLAPPSPRADPQGCGSLEPASADAPAPFAAALANLTRSRSRVRAGSILLKARAEEDALHRLNRPEDPATARRRLPPHHTHSPPPPPSLTPHLHPSPPPLLHPHTPPRASRHPTPLTPGGTARAAVLGPSCALVASLCIVSSKRSDLFRSRVRSEPTVTFPGRGRNGTKSGVGRIVPRDA